MSNIFCNLLSGDILSGLSKLPSTFLSVLLSSANSVHKNSGFSGFFEGLFESLLNIIYKIAYFIGKFILLLVDLIYSYMLKMCGLEADYSSLESLFSKESDIVFNLLFTATDLITPIIRNLIGLAIVLIIVFTIVALIKSQFDALSKKDDKEGGKVMATLKKTIRAFFLLILTPMMAMVVLAGSNLLLQSLYRATNLSGSMSIGAKMFSTAAVSASTYRNYAESGQKIPITFDPGNAEDILQYYDGVPANSVFAEYIKSSKNVVYSTYMSFYNKTFYDFEQLNDVSGSQDNLSFITYNGLYDFLPASEAKKKQLENNLMAFRRISSYREEYFVMADVIDYALNTGNKIYFKTIESVFDSVLDEVHNNELQQNIFQEMMEKFDIQLYKADTMVDFDIETGRPFSMGDTVYKYSYSDLESNPTAAQLIDIYKSGSWNILSYNTSYLGTDGGVEPNTRMEINKTHVKGSTDELAGAKFIIAVSKEVKDPSTDEIYTYYEPLTIGYTGESNVDFTSEYLLKGQIISAKGTFTSSNYPTAIRYSNNNLEFYRYDIENQATGQISNLVNAKFNPFTAASWISLIKPQDIEIDLSVNSEALQMTYNPTETLNTKLENTCSMQIGYYFSHYGKYNHRNALTLQELFIPLEMNVILLLIAPMLMLKMFVGAFFGIIQRGYELFLMIITYPAVVVSIPLDDQAYEGWWRKFFSKVFLTYGLIIGVNFVLMLFPIIDKIEFFTQEEVATNKLINRVCRIVLFGNLPVAFVTSLLNTVTGILFELAAFTLFESVPQVINNIVSKDSDGTLKSDAFANFMKVVTALKKAAKVALKVTGFVIKFIPGVGQMVTKVSDSFKGISKAERKAQNRRKFKNFTKKLIPGSQIIDAAQDKAFKSKKKKQEKDAKKALDKELDKAVIDEPELNDESSDDERRNAEEQREAKKQQAKAVETALRQELSAVKNEYDAVKDPKGGRQAEDDQKYKNKLLGISDDDEKEKKEKDGEDDEDDEKVSSKKDGEDGGDDDGEDDKDDYKSDRELKKEKKELKKRMKYLKSENRSGKLFGIIKNSSKDERKERKEAIAQCKERIGELKEEQKERKQFNSKKGRAEADEKLAKLRLENANEPVAPTAPKAPGENATEQEKKDYQNQMQQYEQDKKKFDEDKKKYDENQDQIKKLELGLNRKKFIKEHREKADVKEKEQKREQKSKERLDQIREEDDRLFSNQNASPKQIQKRIQEIKERSNEISDKVNDLTEGQYKVEDLMKLSPKELEQLGLNKKVLNLVDEYRMYNDDGRSTGELHSTYIQSMMHKQEMQQSYKAQHEANIKKNRNRKYASRTKVGKFFHPIERARSHKARDLAVKETEIDNKMKLEEMETQLAEMKGKLEKDPSKYSEYLNLNKKYQELKAKNSIGTDYTRTSSKESQQVLKDENRKKKERRKLEEEAFLIYGDGAKTEQINAYIKRKMQQQETEELGLMSEGGGGFLGRKNGKRKRIMNDLNKRQSTYETACKEFYENDPNGPKLESLLEYSPEELDRFLDGKKVKGNTGKTYSSHEKEMLKKYVELTNRKRRYESADALRKESNGKPDA